MISQSKKPIFHNSKRSGKSKDYILPDWTGIAALMLTAGIAMGMLLGLGLAHADELPRTMYVATQTGPLNVRERPSLHAEITARLERGEAVTVVSAEKGWALIDGVSEMGQGWVSAKYLSEEPLEPPELPERFLEVEEDWEEGWYASD